MENIKRIDENRVEIDGQIYWAEEPCKNEVEEKQSNRFKPHIGETYYRIGRNGLNNFMWGNDYVDNRGWEIGNCFKTKKDAEFMIEKLKVLAELSEFTEPKDREWNREEHWHFYWNIEEEKVKCVSNKVCKMPFLYFKSKKIMQQAIETVGEDRIKKYLFGIESEGI